MTEYSLAKNILGSSFWRYLTSWSDKLIGFASTIILARILVPDDFGIVASAGIVTGMFHVIASVGTGEYLIRKKHISNADLDTGWTINIIMKSISALAIFLLAEVIADFMDDQRLVLVLQVASIPPFIAGFANIGMTLHVKNYELRPSFLVNFSTRLTGFFVKISLAVVLQSYWAFILSDLVATLVYLFGTFIAHTYRPKFSLLNWKEQWVFSQWVLLKSIFVFLRYRIDTIFISKFFPAEALGGYSVAKDVATLPAGQVVGPITGSLYVGLSSIHNDAYLFADKVHKAVCAIFIVVLPISLGTYVVSDELVYVLLGDKWQQVIPIVMILSFTLLPSVLGDFLTRVMTALGKVKLIFKLELLFGVLTVSLFSIMARQLTLENLAILRVSTIILNTSIVLIILSRKSELSFFRILGLIFIPLISAVFMVLIIWEFQQTISQYSHLIQLILQVLVGALAYLIMLSMFVYVFRNTIKEYQFIWKTFYISVFSKLRSH